MPNLSYLRVKEVEKQIVDCLSSLIVVLRFSKLAIVSKPGSIQLYFSTALRLMYAVLNVSVA